MRNINSLLTALVLSVSSISAVGCATSGDEYGESDDEAAAAGKLAFSQGADGQWRFNLKSGNGAILLTSEGYTSRTGAINGALSVLDNGVDSAMYQLKQTKTGFVVHLKAANGESVSFSEVYATKSSATRAVTSCVKATTSYLDKREANTTGQRVEVTEKGGQFHFAFFAKNGENIVSSETYDSEAAAFNGAMALQAATNYTVQANSAGTGFYFTVKAGNGEIVGTSQQYTTKASAEKGAASLKKVAASVTVL